MSMAGLLKTKTHERAEVQADGLTTQMRSAVRNETADAAASMATSYSMEVGDSFQGRITAGDSDWIRFDVVAGESYVAMMRGRGGSGGLEDTFLTLYNSDGVEVAYNDDLDSMFSGLRFTAAYTGTYYLEASAYSAAATGNYTLSASTADFTPHQIADYLVNFAWGETTPLRFADRDISVNITGLTAEGQRVARWALDIWSSSTGLSFTEVTSGSAEIRFDDASSGAYASPAYNPSTGIISSASVNVGLEWVDYYGADLDSYLLQTYIHEIGHALGLGHGGPYNGTATWGQDNLYDTDSTMLSIMSYFSASTNPNVNGTDAFVLAPMMADILAIEMLYGSVSAHTGNTTWGRNSTVGGVWGEIFRVNAGEQGTTHGFNRADPFLMTISDTGGRDLLDVSHYSGNQTIDLRPGSFSSLFGQVNNIAVSLGTVIENLRSGSGHDRITGNSASNVINAGSGNDTAYGGLGNDTLRGGAGNDLLYGGSGNDYFYGDVGADRLFGGDGADRLYGGADADRLNGGNGRDVLDGGDGNDVISGEGDHDSLSGGAGEDTLHGGSGNDTLLGDAGNDYIYGGTGADRIVGAAGNDTLDGGEHNDTLYGSEGTDFLYGQSGNDLLYGGLQNDRIFGHMGNDRLYGGDGNDALDGGGNNDILTGGAGRDVFVFRSLTQGETDQITDFQDDLDRIQISGLQGTAQQRFEQISVTSSADGVVLSVGGHRIILNDATLSDVTVDDFIWA